MYIFPADGKPVFSRFVWEIEYPPSVVWREVCVEREPPVTKGECVALYVV